MMLMQTKEDIKARAREILLGTGKKNELGAAIYLAETLFESRVDKAGKPYVGHLQRVASGVPDPLKPAAYLHDTVEDIAGWNFQDLKDIGFGDFTVSAIRAVTKQSEEEPYFDAMVRVGLTPHAIPLKRSDLRDNSNLLRLDRKPLAKDFERVTKYFLADKYLEDIQEGRALSGTPFAQWMSEKPENLRDDALVKKETAKGPRPA